MEHLISVYEITKAFVQNNMFGDSCNYIVDEDKSMRSEPSLFNLKEL